MRVLSRRDLHPEPSQTSACRIVTCGWQNECLVIGELPNMPQWFAASRWRQSFVQQMLRNVHTEVNRSMVLLEKQLSV